jgi:hypothetical protein
MMWTHEDDSPQAKWGGGVMAPIALAIYGISVLVTGEATLRGGRYGGSLELWDFDAQLWGVGLLAGAVALHAMLFWRHHPRLGSYAQLVAGAALMVLIYAVFWLLSRQSANFI